MYISDDIMPKMTVRNVLVELSMKGIIAVKRLKTAEERLPTFQRWCRQTDLQLIDIVLKIVDFKRSATKQNRSQYGILKIQPTN